MSDGYADGERERQLKRFTKIGRLVEHGLLDSVSRAGGQLLGFSVKYANGDCLVTLRALMPSGRMVCFVGAETLGGAVLKAARDANNDKLRWREDQYAR